MLSIDWWIASGGTQQPPACSSAKLVTTTLRLLDRRVETIIAEAIKSFYLTPQRGTGVGYIDAVAIGSDGCIDRAPAHLHFSGQAVGGGVNNGDRVRARIGDVGAGPIGSDGCINGIGTYRDSGNDRIS